MPLTDKQVRAAAWSGKDYTLGDGNGLYLQMRRSSKTWIVRRKREGQKRVTTPGKYPDVSVKEACKRAALIDTKRRPSNTTVEELADEHRAVIERDNRRPYLTTGYLDRGLPPSLLKMRVADSDTALAQLKDGPFKHTNNCRADAVPGEWPGENHSSPGSLDATTGSVG